MVLDGKAQVASVDGNVLRLAFTREGDAKGFSQNGCDTVLREALTETLGVDWRIEATAGAAPATPGAPAALNAPSSEPSAGPAGPGGSSPSPSSGASDAPQRRDAAPQAPVEPEPDPDYDYPDVDDDQVVAAGPDDGLTGLPLLERELGARVIDEPPEPGGS